MNVQELCVILKSLREESQSLSESTPETKMAALMEKYNMIFMGDKANVILSAELCYMLRSKKGVEISMNELHALLPEAAKHAGMKLSPMVLAEDVGNPAAPIENYLITLH